MKKLSKYRALLVFLIYVLLTPTCVWATQHATQDETDSILEQLDLLELDTYSRKADEIIKRGNPAHNMNLMELSKDAITGNLDTTPMGLLTYFKDLLLGEMLENINLIRNIIIIALLAALLKTMDNSFSNATIAQLGHYICYFAIVVLILSSFSNAFLIAQNAITDMIDFMQMLLPLFIAMLLGSGSYSLSLAFHPISIGAIQLISIIIQGIVLPAIVLGGMLNIINHLLPKRALSKLSELIHDTLESLIKALMGLMAAVVTLRGITAPITGGFLARGTKLAVGAIPVVGDALTGAAETVLYWAGAVKSGVSVAIIIFVLAICAAPIIKLAVMAFIYKIMAAVIEPLCDKDFADGLAQTGDFMNLFVLACIGTSAMFIIQILMVLLAGRG